MVDLSYIELFGYLASVVVLVSLLMSSIVKLRWINLLGASMFASYGFIIGALPVGVMNSAIALIDTFYLIKMYSKKEFFKTLEIRPDNKYLAEFLKFYKTEIKEFFPNFSFDKPAGDICFLILRNMSVAGVFMGKRIDTTSLFIELDFVIPEYRDLKPGRYIFKEKKSLFANSGIKQLCAKETNTIHTNYLRKMGFRQALVGDDKCMRLFVEN